MFKGFMKEVVKFQVLLGILPNYSATKIKLSKKYEKNVESSILSQMQQRSWQKMILIH